MKREDCKHEPKDDNEAIQRQEIDRKRYEPSLSRCNCLNGREALSHWRLFLSVVYD